MILGVYFSQKNLKRLSRGSLEFKMNFLAEEALKEGVQILVFSPESIDWFSKTINGLAYNETVKKWEEVVCPFPNVIYDRGTFPAEEKELGKYVRDRFYRECKIPFVNSKSFFNKWETHEVLSKYSSIRKYLPETVRYFHPSQIIELLAKYNSIYIKDSGGKLGKNIFKLQKAGNGFYTLSYQSEGNKYSDKVTLQQVHKRFLADKSSGRTIIIQQGINVAALNDHPFDVRILAQKNDRAVWEVVDKSIRVASPGSVVTNISSGGEVRKFNDVIPLLFSNTAAISAEIDIVTVKVCKALEKRYGKLGELGVDIAIDNKGKVWIIEVNGKPAKLCIYHSGDISLINKTCHNIISYSKELFKQINNEKLWTGV